MRWESPLWGIIARRPKTIETDPRLPIERHSEDPRPRRTRPEISATTTGRRRDPLRRKGRDPGSHRDLERTSVRRDPKAEIARQPRPRVARKDRGGSSSRLETRDLRRSEIGGRDQSRAEIEDTDQESQEIVPVKVRETQGEILQEKGITIRDPPGRTRRIDREARRHEEAFRSADES